MHAAGSWILREDDRPEAIRVRMEAYEKEHRTPRGLLSQARPAGVDCSRRPRRKTSTSAPRRPSPHGRRHAARHFVALASRHDLGSGEMEPLVTLFRSTWKARSRASANTVRAYLADLEELLAHVHAKRAGRFRCSSSRRQGSRHPSVRSYWRVCTARTIRPAWAASCRRSRPSSACWSGASSSPRIRLPPCAAPNAPITCPLSWARKGLAASR